MQGAEYSKEDGRVKLTEKISTDLPSVNFKWMHVDQIKSQEPQEMIQIPVYLNK